MSKIDVKTIKEFQNDLAKCVKSLEKKYGLGLFIRSTEYTDTGFSSVIDFNLLDDDGNMIIDKSYNREINKLMSSMHSKFDGRKHNAIGTVFSNTEGKWKILFCDDKRPVNRWLIKNEKEETFYCRDEYIQLSKILRFG